MFARYSNAHTCPLVAFPFIISCLSCFSSRGNNARESFKIAIYNSLTYIRIHVDTRAYCYFANQLHSVQSFVSFEKGSTRKRKSLQSLATVPRTKDTPAKHRFSTFDSFYFFTDISPLVVRQVACYRVA